MEQQLETAYLRPGPTERAAALGMGAFGIGAGILLATWGISFLWRYTPPEIRIANPEVTVTQSAPLTVSQDKPFRIEEPPPFKITPTEVIIKPEQLLPAGTRDRPSGETKTPAGDVIKREVTVFFRVDHGQGKVVSGWNYPDGRGGEPVSQYCYYSVLNVDGSYRRVDIALNRIPIGFAELVPDLQGALAKCQWSQQGS